MSAIVKGQDKVSKKDMLGLVVQFCVLFPLRVILILLGFVFVPIGLLFAKKVSTTQVQHEGTQREMSFIDMPKLFYIWNNKEEGCASLYVPYWEKCNWKADSYWNMLWWSCIRNPANNARWLGIFNIDFLKRDHIYTKSTNWWFCKSIGSGKMPKYSFRYRRTWEAFGYKGDFIMHLGYKTLEHTVNLYISNPEVFELDHHRLRGFAFQLIPMRGRQKINE